MPVPPNNPDICIEEVPSGIRTIAGVATSITAFVGRAAMGPVDDPVTISGYGDFERIFGGLHVEYPMSYAVRDFFLNGGSTAVIVRLFRKGTVPAKQAVPYRADLSGLYALEKTDLFNLLCIPPDDREGDTDKKAMREAISYCAKRRAVLLVDPPSGWTDVPGILENYQRFLSDMGLSGMEARNAALFFPRIEQADPLRKNRKCSFVPCGIVAGAIARTDVARGVWNAPAGQDAVLNGILGLSLAVTDKEIGTLNSLGINCLRTFPPVGRVVWGGRTLRGADILADEYKYLSVRRTALFIEESLYRGLKWVVLEPNGEQLWERVRRDVGAFMNELFRQGAFQGATPRDAYFVKCGPDTTILSDINEGIVNLQVGFAPLKPAEFVVIRIRQVAGPPRK